ncbi:hypothetical protein HDU91_002965, partial [Kappamyces sp. JEL0680]
MAGTTPFLSHSLRNYFKPVSAFRMKLEVSTPDPESNLRNIRMKAPGSAPIDPLDGVWMQKRMESIKAHDGF